MSIEDKKGADRGQAGTGLRARGLCTPHIAKSNPLQNWTHTTKTIAAANLSLARIRRWVPFQSWLGRKSSAGVS